MRLLAFDTSTEACSAALRIDGEVRERFEHAPRAHGALLLSMIEALMAEAGIRAEDLDAVAFGRGPGAFTGVRIAAGVAQGVAFGAGVRAAPVSSLAALAQGVWREIGARRVLAGFDARMGEVYWAAFEVGDDGLVGPVLEERVCRAEAAPIPSAGTWHGAGTAWATYAEVLSARLGDRLAGRLPDRYPRAGAVAELGAAAVVRGRTVAADQALPVYLRDRVTRS